MAIIGRFIGVGKYMDPGATELPGARRDAIALWSLFSDSIQSVDLKLLVDESATCDAVNKALAETLANAKSDDSVIFYFAGHGTPDHKLVTYDTSVTDWSTTTISLDHLSSLFKGSKAKSVICILDCCFSGGVAARVFENAPIPRANSATLKTFAGEGRILFAASDFDEFSYEIPTTGHGLFTKSLIDVLIELNKPSDIQEIAKKVMEIVRSEGSRFGLQQTPVIFGNIKGGLQLPKFFKGINYNKHFPEASGIKISKEISELSLFNIPNEVISAWKSKMPGGLNFLQLKAINEFSIFDGKSLMVVAPTSSGKTFVGELAAAKAIADNKKVVFLLPYRALVNEKFDYFNELYNTKLGMRVVRCSGDYSDQVSPFIYGKYDIALLTYEMFLGLSVNKNSILNSIGLIVIDEAQFITDPYRGATVELILTQLNTLKKVGINPQILTLSATVGDINHFNEWLELKVLKTNERPVPLTEGVLDRSGILEFLLPSGKQGKKQLIPANFIRTRKQKPGSQDVIVPLVQKLLSSPNEKIIIFRSRRGTASGCAKYLANDLGLPPATEEINQLPAYDLSDTSQDLRLCFSGGTAFHSTDLNREERILVEKSFRANTNNIRVLAATTTVAAGINTPASTVILVENEFPGPTPQPYTVAEYKNMSGRAGRLGFQEEGLSIMLAETSSERTKLFRKYVLGEPEAITSSFSEDNLLTWLLRLFAQIKQIKRQDAVQLLVNTFGGYLKNRVNPGWQVSIKNQIEREIDALVSHNLLEESDSFIRLTQLGIVCGQSTLKFESIIRLIDLIARNGNKLDNLLDLLILIQALPEFDDRYIPFAKNETQWPFQVQRVSQSTSIQSLRLYTPDTYAYGKRSKRVSLLFHWINGYPIDEITKTHSTNIFNSVASGDVRSLADLTRYNLRSVYQIISVLLQQNCPPEEELEKLMKQLEVGIPENGLDLLNLPVPLERGEYLQLINNGILSLQDYWTQSSSNIFKLIGRKAELLELHRPKS